MEEEKKYKSVDEIEKSHADDPGERGEMGEQRDMNNETICLFSDVIGNLATYFWRSHHSVFVQSVKTDKARAFAESWLAIRPPKNSRFILEDGSKDVFLLTSVEVKPYTIVFEFAYYGSIMGPNISFSAPTFTGPRGTEPTMSFSKRELEEQVESFKELLAKQENVVTSQESFENICAGIYRGVGSPLKSTVEREMELMKKLKSGMLTYKREDVCGKFPQMRRAKLNKPKSI